MSAFLKIFTSSKRRGTALLWLALSLLLLCATARAQEETDAPEPQHASRTRPQGRGGPGGILMRRLSLTPEQRQRLGEIRRQSEPRARELTRRARLARRALDEAIYADAVDEALVEQRSRELAAAQAELIRLRAANELSVRRALTPEQLKAFRELRREAQRRHSMRRRGGERPPSPGAPFESPPRPGGAAESPKPRLEGPPPARWRRP